MIRRTGESDFGNEQPREEVPIETPNLSLIDEFLLNKTGSLRNSKEEKERQNEVISGVVCGQQDAPEQLLLPLMNSNSSACGGGDNDGESSCSERIRNTTTSDSGLFSNTDDYNSTPKRSNAGACFIDASTLYDETEFSSLPTTVNTESPFRSNVSSACSSQPPSVDCSSRQESEKRQGYLVFKNSIHQYSGHPIPSTTTSGSAKDVDDFEILDFPEENSTPQNSLAYIPIAADDDDKGRVEEPAPIFMATKHQKHNDSAPILSGGMSICDFKKSVTDSPSVRRRTEMCPIISGGSVDIAVDDMRRNQPKKRSSSVTSSSWIVDLSDCKSDSSYATNDFSSLKYNRDNNSPKPSLSFYVNIDSNNDKKSKEINPKSLQVNKSTGFFIDLSSDDVKSEATSVPMTVVKKEPVKEIDKKNIFSMFIDFGDGNKKPRSATPRLSSSFSNNKCMESSFKAPTPAMSTSSKEKSKTQIVDNKILEAKRPNTFPEKVNDIIKEQTIPEQSPSPPDRHSITSDSFTSNTTSHDGNANKKRQNDAKINETFDKSSPGSLTDGILSKDLSPISSETDDATFQKDSDGSFIPKRSDDDSMMRSGDPSDEQKSEMQSAMDTLNARIERQKQLLDTPTNDGKTFVKLSDMDNKPTSTKYDFAGNIRGMSISAGTASKRNWVMDSRNTGESLKHTNILSPSEGNVPLASSVENSKSLSRLFPHLSDVFSKSLPNDVDLNNYRNSSYLADIAQSDISNTTTSSVTSGLDSPDESSISCRQPRRLGEDLLKMFLQEIATDIVVEVGNKKMRAHKCILRSRCQYFAAILAGNWVQNAGNVISLSGYSYAAVHFALCHIYSGASYPPEGISLMELASLSDLLGLEGLKEVTTYALKINYCHNFHKPCSGCIEGVMQVFPVTLNHGLDDLYRKCLKWSCKYWAKVWPTRSFALLPTDVIYRCRQQILAHMSSESVLSTIIDCEQMLSVLELSRWAIVVENVVREVLESGHMYIADHFANLLASDSFLSLGHGKSWAITHLENLLLRTASTLTPDQACKSYPRAVRLNTLLTVPNSLSFDNGKISTVNSDDDDSSLTWNDDFVRLISAILTAVEQCLIRQCARAMRCSSWQRMDPNLKSKIQKLACITDVIEDSNMNNNKKSASLRSKIAPNYHTLSQQSRDSGLNQIRMAIQAHNNKRNVPVSSSIPLQPSQSTNAVPSMKPNVPRMGISKTHRLIDEQRYNSIPVTTNPPKSAPRVESIERVKFLNGSIGSTGSSRKESNVSVTTSDRKSSTTSTGSLHKSRLSDVKPRYLEPKKIYVAPPEPEHKPVLRVNNRSNNSSRTASPVIAHNRKMADSKTSQDSNISLDSLSSPHRKKSSIISSKHTSKESLSYYNSHGKNAKGITQKENLETKSQVSLRNARNRIGSASSTHSASHSSSLAMANRAVNNLKSKSTDTSPGNAPKSFFTQRSRNILLKKQHVTTRTTMPVASVVPIQLPTSARERNKLRSQLGVVNVPLPPPSSASTVKSTTIRKSTPKTAIPPNKTTPSSNHFNNKIDLTKEKNEKNTAKKRQVVSAGAIKQKESQPITCEEVIFDESITYSRLERSSTFCKESSDITDLVQID